ncbi:MAG: hypothetical protein EXS35_10050 [Pedosphaera sp.]|nr:hypothetical protein [Pedosphaera sp.]
MIGTIRKHSKVLWAIIITIVIITFVFWGSQPSKTTDRGRTPGYLGSISGVPIKLEDYYNAEREVALGYYFNYGEFPGDEAKRVGFDVGRETYIRLFILHKLEELDIHVSDETVTQKAGEIMRMVGRGTPAPFAAFEKNVLNAHGLSALDFTRWVRNELGRQQLVNAVAAAGRLVTPQEARVLYERENEELATEAVFFSATNYLSTVTVSPEGVNQFWTNQMSRYRLPERVQVRYVAFDVSNYLAQAEADLMKTNLTELVEGNYARLGTNLYREAKTPEEAKAKIRADIIKEVAGLSARRDANNFANVLDDKKSTPPRIDDLDKLAAEQKLTVKVSAPFDAEEGPKEMVVLASFIKESFKRTPEDLFAGPLGGRDAAYVIALDKRLPSEIPPLESIREKVTADFKFSQAVLAAHRAGESLALALTNGLAAGKKFTSLCVAAGAIPVPLPPVSLSTRAVPEIEEHVSLYQYKQAAFTTQAGKSSGFITTADGGFVLFVRDRLPLELAKMTKDLPAFINAVRATRQNEAYSDWFRREADRALRETPLYQQQRPQPGAPAKK